MSLGSFIRAIIVGSRRIQKQEEREYDLDTKDRYEANGLFLNPDKGRHGQLETLIELYRGQPWVHVCAKEIATACASVDWQLERNGKVIEDDDMKVIFEAPNAHDTWYDLVYATFLYLELAGNEFWELVRDEKRKLRGIFPLMPHRMTILPHPKKKVSGYLYYPGVNYSLGEIVYDTSEILHLRYFDPTDQHWGMPSIMASESSLILDFYARKYNKDFFVRGAEPGGVLETDRTLSPAAFNRLRENYLKRHQGHRNTHVPAILEEGLKYKPLAFNQRDMQFDKLRHMTKEEVYRVMGVPEDWPTNVNSRKSFWMNTIIPKLRQVEQAINVFLSDPETLEGEDLDKLKFRFVTRSIESMVEDEQVKIAIATSLVSHGIMTPNEIRERYWGLKKKPWGDLWWAPVGLQPVDSGKHPGTGGENPLKPGLDNNRPGRTVVDENSAGQKAPSQVPNLGRGNPNSKTGSKKPPVEKSSMASLSKNEWVDLGDLEVPEPEWTDRKAVWMWKRWVSWQKAAAPDERRLTSTFRDFFEAQYRRAVKKLKGWSPPKKDDRVEKADPKIDAFLLDLDEEGKFLESIYIRETRKTLEKHGNVALADIGVTTDFNMRDARLLQWMREYTGSRAESINEYTNELLKKTLIKAEQDGVRYEDAVDRVGQLFLGEGGIADYRARRIARTELITLTNEARLEAALQTGIVKTKVWISELLPTTRQEDAGPNHAEMHGVVIPIDEKFLVKSRSGTDQMSGPGDLDASPENVVNCLCVLEYPPDDPGLAELFQTQVVGEVSEEQED